jgi:hypothetical protein
LILGREPALWLAVLQTFLAFLVGFQWDGLSAEQAALWLSATNAVIAVIMAVLTRPWSLSVFTNAFAILATLAAAYGLNMSQPMVASANALISAVVILIARGQISPTPEAAQTGVLGMPSYPPQEGRRRY